MRPGAALLPPPCRHDQQQGRDVAELLSGDLSRLAPLINALFFGLVGASLKLSGGCWLAGAPASGQVARREPGCTRAGRQAGRAVRWGRLAGGEVRSS